LGRLCDFLEDVAVTRWLKWIAFLAVVAALGTAALSLFGSEHRPPGDRPNIVFIVADDQRWDTLWAMPTVRSRLARRGIRFTNGFVVNSVCCPSRASILTGQYSHSNGVYRNSSPQGGFASFDDSSTVATWLQDAGYRTALIGKYLNGYERAQGNTYVPPGWDRWVAFADRTRYYRYVLNVDGRPERHGGAPDDYSTDVLAEHAVGFIRETEGPFFLLFTPWAPHAVGIAPPRHERKFLHLPPWRPSNYDEADVTDKPRWVRRLPRFTSEERAGLDEKRINMLRTLPALDEAVGKLLDGLQETGRLSNTLVVYTSDNGYSWGEHRWVNKQTPYEHDIRVPFVVRYDPLVSDPDTDPRFVLNIDLAATAADLARVDAPDVDGRSLLPVLGPTKGPWRQDFLIEHLKGDYPAVPTYCALRNERFTYVEYATGEEELYDLRGDPDQLQNALRAPELRSILPRLRARLAELCLPPPPGLRLRS